MRSSLRSRGLSANKFGAGPNPMDGLSNLADCMLVLACGLMLALIVNWNLDLAVDNVAPEETASPSHVEDMEESTDEIDAGSLEEMGMVYRDPETGELYMIMNSEP